MTPTWWRAHAEAVHDPKIQRLPGELFKVWFNLLCLTCSNGGTLPRIEDVAFHLRCDEKVAKTNVSLLINVGLIDETEQGLIPHNWERRQYLSDVSTKRVRAFRERQRNVSETEVSNKPETPPDTDTETEQNREVSKNGADAPDETIDETFQKNRSNEGPDTSYADVRHELWAEGPVILDGLGFAGDKKKMIGKWLKGTALNGVDRPEIVLDALRRAERATPLAPIPWIVRALAPNITTMRATNGTGNLNAVERLQERLRSGASEHRPEGVSSPRKVGVRGVRVAGGDDPRELPGRGDFGSDRPEDWGAGEGEVPDPGGPEGVPRGVHAAGVRGRSKGTPGT